MTREQWLLSLTNAFRPRFEELGHPIPADVYTSVGFPSKRPLGKKKRIGECWHGGTDQPHVYVSPLLDQDDAAHVLLHELIHAALPTGSGHKKPFISLAKALGLCKPWTATTPSDECREWLESLVADIGPYPHDALAVQMQKEKPQATRLLKLECGCGRILRGAKKTIDLGPIVCGVCMGPFQGPEEEDKDIEDEKDDGE